MSKRISSNSPFETSIGFSRAVHSGNHLLVSGTAPIAPDGGVASPGDLFGQTKRCLEIILKAVSDAGFKPEHVVRTRVFLTDITRWEDAARAHGAVFKDIRPACTFVEVKGLINPEWLVEIEADCLMESSVV